jgi:hypothetical protein
VRLSSWITAVRAAWYSRAAGQGCWSELLIRVVGTAGLLVQQGCCVVQQGCWSGLLRGTAGLLVQQGCCVVQQGCWSGPLGALHQCARRLDDGRCQRPVADRERILMSSY